jgi:hypothetical protein
VLRGLLLGGAAGVFLGVLARGLMRLIGLGNGVQVEFHLGVSLAIVSLFAASGAGAGLAGSLGLPRWAATLLVLVTSAPLFLMGGAIGLVEVVAVIEDPLSLARTAGLLALAGLIGLCVLATPYAAWRVGRARPRRHPDQSA